MVHEIFLSYKVYSWKKHSRKRKLDEVALGKLLFWM